MTDMHVLPGAGAPAQPVHRPTRFYRFAAIVSWPVVFGLYRFKQRGLDKVPAAGGFVLAANHNSNFDPWPLGAAFFPGRYLRFMTKSELFWWPLRVLLEWGGAFPVNRKEADVKAIQTAVELCRCGHIVVMFPEGTRRRKGSGSGHGRRRGPAPPSSPSVRASRSSPPRCSGPTSSGGSSPSASITGSRSR